MNFLQSLTSKSGEFAVLYGTRIVGVIVLFLVGRWVAKVASHAVNKLLVRRKVDGLLVQFATNMVRYALMAFVVLACLELFGVETMSFVAVLGAAGLAIGLALQGTLAHFAAGVMLLIYRPFRLGDVIQTADVTGAVEKLELFSTTLITPDRKTITVPNGKIWGSTLQNLSDQPSRRVDVEVSIAYGADLALAQSAIVNALRTIPGVMSSPAPEAAFTGFDPTSMKLELHCHCIPADYLMVREQMLRVSKQAIDQARLSVPFAQLGVHFDAQEFPLVAKPQAPTPRPSGPH